MRIYNKKVTSLSNCMATFPYLVHYMTSLVPSKRGRKKFKLAIEASCCSSSCNPNFRHTQKTRNLKMNTNYQPTKRKKRQDHIPIKVIIEEIRIKQCLNKPGNPSCNIQTIETRIINTNLSTNQLRNWKIYRQFDTRPKTLYLKWGEL